MSDAERKEIARTQMPPEERRLRSRLLLDLLGQHGVVRGALSVRYRTCGKAGCTCARGEKHRGLYLVFREGGRYRQVFVPQSHEARVRQSVEQYQEVRRLSESLSALHVAQVSRKDGGDGA